ncbi:2,4-dichlorophenol 6-monooxygenase-like [Telopea speciosissima]|uniref:2,4-dichlorophenol 6-monooxygenase-like n=1 Tax=Telopea speciosissima TaxID=54955 RepID=UPI001CC6574F|nr:2,4-dichlorophenol 6-monooxygenase-like [Telopea speciosissima]
MEVPRSMMRFKGFSSTRIKLYPLEHLPRRSFSDLKENFSCNDEVLPVLIVGAGPVGLVLSILLTKLGVKCAVLEKSKTFSQHPQAHFINNRSMEVFRKLNGLAKEIQKLQPPVDSWRKYIYCTSLSGYILGSVDQMQPQDFEQVVSPVSVAHFSQYKLTRLLLKQLENLEFHISNGDGIEELNHRLLRERMVLMGHECVSIKASDHCLTVGASFIKEGKKTERNILCKILVGADGAGSIVRKLMGIGMQGERELQKFLSIHFLSQDLGQYLLHERPGMIFFIFNKDAMGVLVAHDLSQGEFVLQMPFYPPQQNLRDFNSKACEELISKIVGWELGDLNVIDIKPWVMHAEVAEKFVACDNRVILAGDAAHRFPPVGGFGMNTGVQDAHNVAWKIASVLQDISPHSILQTYEMERKPIAIFNARLSVQNFKGSMAVPTALGINPAAANSVHRIINSGMGSILPSGVQRAILAGIFAAGRAQISKSLLNDNNPLGSLRLAKVRRIFDEGKSLRLQFPAEDLGFRYLEGALVPGNYKASHASEAPNGSKRDYVPSAEPGLRLPHMNVRMLPKLSSEEVFSTLDLVSGDKVEFLLIIAPKNESYNLAQAALKVVDGFGVSLKICVMWPPGSVKEIDANKTALMSSKDCIHVEEIRRASPSPSPSPSWWDICQMTDRGAILVRPDEHIAWRTKSEVSDPTSEMENVFSLVLMGKKTCL